MSTCITIPLSTLQAHLLHQLTHAPTVEQGLAQRARILLTCATEPSNQSVARHCGTNRETVRKWRRRWLAARETLTLAETAGTTALKHQLIVFLRDAPRAGRPPTFTAEQIAQLFALACTKPEDHGCEGTHWTAAELAYVLQQQQVVQTISPRHVGRFLKAGRPQTTSPALLAEHHP
ncbi:MAG: helix-turn-helix domain-containing protein [Armatimonadota bacterium]